MEQRQSEPWELLGGLAYALPAIGGGESLWRVAAAL